MLYFLLAAALVVLDQVVKLLVRHNIPLGGSITLIPGVMDLSYVQNTGAAFSLFQEHTWVLAVVSLVVAVLLILALIKKIFTRPWGVISLAVVLAGAVGNLIDRVFLGFVTDMFATTFVNFAVFNVADVGVVLGGVLLCLHLIVFFGREGKKEPDKEETP